MHLPRGHDRDHDRGFTLIEVLVVVMIIGVLAGIAIPIFLRQRGKAIEAGEESDARSLATQMMTFYADAQRYPTAGELSWAATPNTVQFGTSGEIVRLSPHNVARIASAGSASDFCIEVRNTVTSTIAVFESAVGGVRAVGTGVACPSSYDAVLLAYPVG